MVEYYINSLSHRKFYECLATPLHAFMLIADIYGRR